MSEGRTENIATGDGTTSVEPKKGQLELREHVFVTGYVGFFGEGNTAGEVIDADTVVRPPKWIGTEVTKDSIGIKVKIAVPADEMPAGQPDLEAGVMERRIAELEAQLAMPLTPNDVNLLKGVLSAEKVKLGDQMLCMQGLALIEKLDGFLNPTLPFNDPEETVAVAPSNPESDDEETV